MDREETDILAAEDIQSGLKTKILGKRIFCFRQLDSTMDSARRLAAEGHAEGSLVIAEKQLCGRGRLKRKWHSPYRQGLYFSLLLRPQVNLAQASLLTIAAAISAAETIRKISGLKALIKWPNDVLVAGKKICGVLSEISTQRHKVDFLILGVGLNVNTQNKYLPRGATSMLSEYNSSYKKKLKRLDRIEVLAGLLENLEENYLLFKDAHYAELISRWRVLSSTLGKHLKINCQGRVLEGYVQDLDMQGALVLRQDHGLNVRITAGDAVRVR